MSKLDGSDIGGLALLLAVLWLSTWTWPRELISVIPSVVGRIPLYLLGFMIMFRILSTKPYLIGFVLWFFIPVHQDRATWYQACVSTYNLWWPLALAAIAYYVWEAPTQLAQQDRLLVGQSAGRSPFPQRDMSISPRRAPLSWMGDVIEYALLAIACFLFVQFYSTILHFDSFRDPLSYITLIFPGAMTYCAVVVCRGFFQQAQCSGFGAHSAFGLVLMQMTAILNPLAQALGLKKGIVSRCDRCHMRKFIWQPECLHCGNPGPGTISNKRLASVVQGKPLQTPWGPRFAIKAMIPLQLFLVLGLMGRAGNRPFVAYGVFLEFGQGVDQQIRERATSHIKDWVEANTSLENWLVRSTDSTGALEDVPERFRLNVRLFDTGSLWVQGLGLRWDPAVTLPEQMAQHLANQIKDICPVQLVPSERVSYASSPLFQTRGYLDNQIHWKVP